MLRRCYWEVGVILGVDPFLYLGRFAAPLDHLETIKVADIIATCFVSRSLMRMEVFHEGC